MKKINFDFVPEKLRLWGPSLVGIPAMLALGFWIKALGFLLFAHHLFWMIGVILLINPVSETFWPSPAKRKSNAAPSPPSVRSRRQAKRKPVAAAETLAQRLGRLRKEKERLDDELESLTDKSNSRKR